MTFDAVRYAELFRTESREQLQTINRALLAMESGDGSVPAALAEVFRAVHTIKGMSATLGYQSLADFSHEMESTLDALRSGNARSTPALLDALFSCADALESALGSSTEHSTATDPMTDAITRLRAAAHAPPPLTSAPPLASAPHPFPLPPPPPLPVSPADPLVGPGVIVRVRQSAEAILPGVRAFLVVEKLRALGDVGAVWPPVEVLQTADTPQSFAVRLSTQASVEAIEAAARSAGDVEHVDVDVAARTRRASLATRALTGEETDREPTAPSAITRQVRLDPARLDTLVNLIGELVIARGRLLQLTATHTDPAVDETMQHAARLIGELQSEIMTIRMVPVGQVFDRFPRLVRDAARQLGKEVTFVIEGKEIELDRALLDEVGEPVVHLLRNAIDHGIEAPSVRSAMGKPRAGRLSLTASRDRVGVQIRVGDDGRGIDRQRVLMRARELGLIDESLEALDEEQLLRCIAQPGFSTADAVSDMSGRGVGLDAVWTRARALGGALSLHSVDGEGTVFTMRVPATLAIVRAVLARAGTERYALPLAHVRETLEYDEHSVQTVKGREVLVLRDEVLPLLYLRDVVLQSEHAGTTREIVVLEHGDRRSGLVVDELLGQQDYVVKPFDAAREGLAIFTGATILPDGAPALIVDVGSLVGSQ